MQPQTAAAPPQETGFKPKWRHFHPLDRVWLQNPFDKDIVFQVADEYNRPFKYLLRAHEVSELPGGAIATLGVKRIVDQLIQNNKDDTAKLWDPGIRAKYEADVIMRIKEGRAPATDGGVPGVVDLSVQKTDSNIAPPPPAKPAEEAFPGLNQAAPAPAPSPTPVAPNLAPLPADAQAGLDDVIGASLPSEDAEIPPNNDNSGAEG